MREHRFALALAAAVMALWVAALVPAWLALPPPREDGILLAFFPPSASADQTLAAISRAEARPVGPVLGDMIWLVDADPGGIDRLRAEGALLVLTRPPFTPAMVGCSVPDDGAR